MKKLLISLLACIMLITLGNTVFAESEIKTEEDNIKTTIEKYYDMSYDSYLDLEMKDMSSVLDANSLWGKNFLIVMEENISSMKYSHEKGYSDFEQKRLPLTISFSEISIDENVATVKVKVDGDRMEGYPLFICFDENIFTLKEEDGHWLITAVECDDVLFKMLNTKEFQPVDSTELHKKIDEEFDSIKEQTENTDREYPYEDYYYSTSRAVNYANNFVSNGNNYFYNASPVDCTNFVSQCVSYGFGNGSSYSSPSSYRMVQGTWSAGSGGGFPAWETVSSHWNYMLRSKPNEEGPRVANTSWSSLQNGGIMQIDFDYDGVYDHSVICVSKEQEKFAQHSDNGYRYYSQYNGSKRFYQPSFFREY